MQIIITKDGSSSIYREDLGEHYHSIHGAVQESRHVFIQSGLLADMLKPLNKVSILEIGLGTGLNALLTCFAAQEIQKQIHYTAIEPYPLNENELQLLNYGTILPYPQAEDVFSHIHAATWEEKVQITDHFSLCKHKISALDMDFSQNAFHLVYFDAFSPEVQPLLWTETLLEKMYHSLKQNSVFVTYSTKGSVKRALKQVGFSLEKLPGPVGKREILRAVKIIC